MSIQLQLKQAIEEALPGAEAEVTRGVGPGHFNVTVISAGFAGKSIVECHRLVYSALAPFMEGVDAPVHAVDHLQTRMA